jgi:hypothetical protein
MKDPAAGGKAARGAKPGERRGGRAVGSQNRDLIRREKLLAEAMERATRAIGTEAIRAMLPKDVMLFVMRLSAEQGWWFKAAEIAKEVAPYIHAKLANTVIDDQRRKVATDYSDEELSALEEMGSVVQASDGDGGDRVVN